MYKEGESVHLSEEEASGGTKDGVVRWVLIIGTLLAIVALSAIWITGAISADNANINDGGVQVQAKDQHLGKPLPAQTSEDQQTVENNLPVVTN